jgi:hypothetical protein
MRKQSIQSLLVAALLAGALPLANAQESNSAAPPQGQGGAPLPNVAQATAEALNTAIEHMDAGDYAQAKEVIGELDKSKKIRVFKKKRRKQYRRTKGHRSLLTRVRITDIQV